MAVRHPGRLSRVARRVHLGLGIGVVVLSLLHEVAILFCRGGIKPFSSLGWLREHLLLGLFVLLPGLLMIVAARWRTAARPVAAATTSGMLALVAFLIFTRYFDPLSAILTVAGLVNGVALCFSVLGPGRWCVPAVILLLLYLPALAGAALFIGTGHVRGRTEAPIIEAAVATRAPLPVPAGATGDPCAAAERAATSFAESPAAQAALTAALRRAAAGFSTEGLAPAYCRCLIADLADKQRAVQGGARLSAGKVEPLAIEFERFRLATYLSSGVAPKRYFGFFDEEGDTAAHERALRQTIIEAIPIINRFALEQQLAARIVDQEVALTFLAEGGALLLTEGTDSLDRIHPVRGIGLDNFRDGFTRYAKLVTQLDEHFGTGLQDLVFRAGGRAVLLRPMTFRESILGTALMYLFEKQLAAGQMPAQGPGALMAQPLPRQFVITSLVYNSGISFSDERVDQILAFGTAEYLADLERRHRTDRRPLPVLPPDEARRRLLAGAQIPQQLTSWSAVYHVLQRYGAWVALQRFSDVFDEAGRFKRRG